MWQLDLKCVMTCGCLLTMLATAQARGREAPALSVTATTSSQVTVAWKPVPSATAYKVFLAPEPGPAPGAPMPAEVLYATLDGKSAGHVISKLAPDVNVFIRVVAMTPDGSTSAHVHARTVGGPRAALDGPVREVRGYSPNTLMVVLSKGSGKRWQKGKWTVKRADGSSLRVRRVHRHSIPVSAPRYREGWDRPYSDRAIDVDHRIFLVLSKPVGNRAMLTVTGPDKVGFTLPFSDRYLETPLIQVNQVGYNPRSTKRWAYVSGWMGDGGPFRFKHFPRWAEVLLESDDQSAPRSLVVADLEIRKRKPHDRDAGTEVRDINLARVPAGEGFAYRIRIPGVGVSWRTAVSEQAAFRAFYVVTRGLFLNRWGGDLDPKYTAWSRPKDHPFVYTAEKSRFDQHFSSSQPRRGKRSLAGGYHDAGDFDQRPMHTVVPQLLMRAFELAPDHFPDGQLNIPESGNGIPDLLDEALWGIAGWEQLQEKNGGVRMGVESHRHPKSFYLASDDRLPYWTYSRDPKVSARVAGLFAQAARLLKPFDPKRARKLEKRAIKAYRWATAKGSPGPHLLYGAGELFRLTGQDRYREDFGRTWHRMGPYGAFNNLALNHLTMSGYKTGKPAMPDFFLGYLGHPGASVTIRDTVMTWISNYAEDNVESFMRDHAHRNPRPTTYPFTWGQGTNTARYMDTVVARMQLGDLTENESRDTFDILSLAADYMLGCNPNGLVYITGLGSRRVQEPLHLDSLVFIKRGKGPMPGIPVYGPVDDLPNVPWEKPTLATFHPRFDRHPKARRYGDVRTLVECSEFTVWETQAPMAQLFAILLGPGWTQDKVPEGAGVDWSE